MTTRPGFTQYISANEQDLMRKLNEECTQIHGVDVYYLPRTGRGSQNVINEDEYGEYNSFHVIEMYIKSNEEFEGDGQLLAKWGLEIRDSIRLEVVKHRFEQEVTTIHPEIVGPRDGDVVYIPMTKSAWQIGYSKSTAVFYQLGDLYKFEIKADLLEFNNDVFNTGIKELDDRYNKYNTSLTDVFVDPDDPAIIFNNELDVLFEADKFDSSQQIQDEADEILDFSTTSPFGVSE